MSAYRETNHVEECVGSQMNVRSVAYGLSLILVFTMPWKDLVDSQFGTVGKLLGIVLASVWGMSVMISGRLRRITLFHVATMLFFIWSSLSLFWSINPGETIYRTLRYVQMFALTVIIWDLYTEKTQIRAALQALLLGTWIPILSTFANYQGGVQAVYGRFAATGQVANFTAVLAALGVPIAWYLVSMKGNSIRSRLLQISNALFIPASVFAISLTATRFAMIMATIAFIYGASTLLTSDRRFSWALVLVLLVATPLTVFYFAPESSIERLASIQSEVIEGDLTGRTRIWKNGLQIWFEHPFCGVGAGAFPTGVAMLFGKPIAAHNSFVSISAELGLIGIILFLWILFISFVHAFRQTSHDSFFWLTLFSIWLLANLALSWEETQQTWFLLTLLTASAALREPIHRLGDERNLEPAV